MEQKIWKRFFFSIFIGKYFPQSMEIRLFWRIFNTVMTNDLQRITSNPIDVASQSRIYIWQVISSTLLNHQRRLDAFNNPLLQKSSLRPSGLFSFKFVLFVAVVASRYFMVALGKYLIVVLSAFFLVFLDFLVIEMCPRQDNLSAGQITENFPFFSRSIAHEKMV